MSHYRDAVTAAGAPGPGGPYSHAIRANGFLYCSGQLALDPDTREFIDGSVGDQIRRCLDNLVHVCEAAGANLSDAVRVTVYVTDMGMFAELNEAYAGYFERDPPTRSVVCVVALPLGGRVMIDAVVALED